MGYYFNFQSFESLEEIMYLLNFLPCTVSFVFWALLSLCPTPHNHYPFGRWSKVEANQGVKEWVNGWCFQAKPELILFLSTISKFQVQSLLSFHCYPSIYWLIYSNIYHSYYVPSTMPCHPFPTVPSTMPSPLQGLRKGLLHEWRKDALFPWITRTCETWVRFGFLFCILEGHLRKRLFLW